jgi:hypothetical protein
MPDPESDTSLPTDTEFSFLYDARQSLVVCLSDDDEIHQLRHSISHTRANSPSILSRPYADDSLMSPT